MILVAPVWCSRVGDAPAAVHRSVWCGDVVPVTGDGGAVAAGAVSRWRALDAGGGAAGGGPAGGALAMTVQRDERERAPRTRFMITDILHDAAPRDLSAHRDSDSDRSATDSPGKRQCGLI